MMGSWNKAHPGNGVNTLSRTTGKHAHIAPTRGKQCKRTGSRIRIFDEEGHHDALGFGVGPMQQRHQKSQNIKLQPRTSGSCCPPACRRSQRSPLATVHHRERAPMKQGACFCESLLNVTGPQRGCVRGVRQRETERDRMGLRAPL